MARSVRFVAVLLLFVVPRRSFVITDEAILDAFSFERVTQNAKPGLAVADAPHCGDFLTNGQPSFNGFPRRCPTPEGQLAKTNPFVPAAYVPLAITNRFDQAPADGANCGQYRITYAKPDAAGRNLLHVTFAGSRRMSSRRAILG